MQEFIVQGAVEVMLKLQIVLQIELVLLNKVQARHHHNNNSHQEKAILMEEILSLLSILWLDHQLKRLLVSYKMLIHHR